MAEQKPKRKNKPGAGRPKEPQTGKRVQIYLAEDLLPLWEQIPRRKRSKIASQAIREFLARQ